MGVWSARLVSLTLLGVLAGSPAVGAICAQACAPHAGQPAASGDHDPGSGDCHPASDGSAAIDSGGEAGCRDHPLPEDLDLAVLSAAFAATSAPSVIALVPAGVPWAALLSIRVIAARARGPSAPLLVTPRPPLVLRI